MEVKKVVILGAGLSGISTAAKLLEWGIDDFVVLEPENRVGGRIHSVDFGGNGKKIDLGAQWIHGEVDNDFYDILKNHFIFGSSQLEELGQRFLFSNGSTPNQEQCTRLYELSHKILEKSEEKMRKFNGSIGEFFLHEYLNAVNKCEYEDISVELKRMMIDNVHREALSFYASQTWFELSAKLNHDYEIAKGDHYITWKDKGFHTAFDIITNKLDVKSRVRLNEEVININWSQLPGHRIIVKCASGLTYSADRVVVTVPIGVLQARHQILFTPTLPEDKVLTIENYGNGNLGKIFLEFEEPFWPTDGSFGTFSFLWHERDVDELKSSDKEWLLGISTFHNVDSFSNVIQAFVSGVFLNTFESISDQKLIDDCLWMLEKFLGRKLPKLLNMARTNWGSNKNFLGSYTYIGRGFDEFNVRPSTLAEPLRKTNGISFLHFAGEATDIKYPSYVQGAVSSGWRAAEEILNPCKKMK